MIKELSFRRKAPSIATPRDIAELETALGLRIPSALAEFCSRWNGGFPGKENSFYPVPARFGEFHKEYGPNGLGVAVDRLFGAAEEFPQAA